MDSTMTNNRYLWAVGKDLEELSTTELIKGRYQIVKSRSIHLWLDTLPDLAPEVPDKLEPVKPYLLLHPYQLHLPQLYGVCSLEHSPEILLLENIPVDRAGQLYPSLISGWEKASPVRQLYWLWQILDLWTPMAEVGVTASWLDPENIRVEGWRVRLTQLHSTQTATLEDLAVTWQALLPGTSPGVQTSLAQIIQQMPEINLETTINDLNQLLLQQAALQPLRLRVVGATDAGPQHLQNEDTCYPLLGDLPSNNQTYDPLIPFLSIVCDGVGGHEGGEVASQLAVETVKLQIRALLKEVSEDPQLMTPELVAEQLQEILRVVNNMIAGRNDEQQRESRRRMGTTLIMALQLPQQIATTQGKRNSHELYLVSVGDSRAYWLTEEYCHLLTVDDDVANREVRLGRSLYRQALQRVDALALTQAIGTRSADNLSPKVQRLIIEEDGLLLLCSDGLSDHGRVEESWQGLMAEVTGGKITLETAVDQLLAIASQRNGHDNASVVLTYCSVTPEYPVLLNADQKSVVNLGLPQEQDSFLFPASAQLLYEDSEPSLATPETNRSTLGKQIAMGAGVVAITFLVGLGLWSVINPTSFQQQWQRIFPTRSSLDRL
jgi:protein phosphatase